jgi:hypothetical protein
LLTGRLVFCSRETFHFGGFLPPAQDELTMTTGMRHPVLVELNSPDDYRTIQARLAGHLGLRPLDEGWGEWLSGKARRITFVFETKEDAEVAAAVLSEFLPDKSLGA